MAEIEFIERLNGQTCDFMRWVTASEIPGVDTLLGKAYEHVGADLSSLDGRDTCVALRDHLAKLLRDIVVAELVDLDRAGDDLNEPPSTLAALRRYLLCQAYCSIDCRTAAEELLMLKGKWAPTKADGATT